MLTVNELSKIAADYEDAVGVDLIGSSSPNITFNKLFDMSDRDRNLTESEIIEFFKQIVPVLEVNQSDAHYKQTCIFINSLFQRASDNDELLKSLQFLNKANELSANRIFQAATHAKPLEYAEACVLLISRPGFMTHESDLNALYDSSVPLEGANALLDLERKGSIQTQEEKRALFTHPHPLELSEAIVELKNVKMLDSKERDKKIDSLYTHPDPKSLAQAFISIHKNGPVLTISQINQISRLKDPIIVANSLIDLTQVAGITYKEVYDAIIAHSEPQKLANGLINLHQNKIHIRNAEEVIINAKHPVEFAKNIVVLNSLRLDEQKNSAILSLSESQATHVINALAQLKQHNIQIRDPFFAKFINNPKSMDTAEVLIQLQNQAPRLFLDPANIKMIIEHERPRFVHGVLQSLETTKKVVTQEDLDKIEEDSYKDWRSDKVPSFEFNQPTLNDNIPVGVPEPFKKELEARARRDYAKSLRLMERSVNDVALSYIRENSQVIPPFPQGKAKNDQAGPLLQFANVYSERYLDLLKAYVSMEKKKGIPMIPVTAGQMKLHGFTSEEILKMQPACKVYAELVEELKKLVTLPSDYDKLVILMVGNNSKLNLDDAIKLSKSDFEMRMGLSLSEHQFQNIIATFTTYKNLDTAQTDLIKRAHFLMHDFGHMPYPKIAEQLDAVGGINPTKLPDANEDERLLMEIRHRVGGDSTIHQNSPGTLGSNPLAYLNVLSKGEPGNPEAEFRNKMFFVYMANHFANAVVQNDETVGAINQWLQDNKKDWSLDLSFITSMRQRGAQYLPPIFRYGANAALNREFRHGKSDEGVAEYYQKHKNISVREAMEGSADHNALHRGKLSDREYFNQMGELSYTGNDPRTERKLNFGTGAAIFDLAKEPTSSMSSATQAYLASVNALGLPVCAGISGTLDQSTAMAGLVGLGTNSDLSQRQYELETIRMAYLAFMLPGSDHTVHEIMQSGKTYGLPYVAGPGYEQYIYSADSANIKQHLESLQEMRGSALPSYFFSEEYIKKTLSEIEQQSKAAQMDLTAFVQRIEIAKHTPLQSGLAKKLSPEEYSKLLEFFSNPDAQDLKIKLSLLEPGQSHRFAKEETGLPRTVNILRGESGEYKLIVETKSKLAHGIKDPDAPIIRGAIKTGKPSWRLDVQEEYFGLTMTVDLTNSQQQAYTDEIKRESDLSRQLSNGSDNICATELGTEFEKNGKKKITVYSPKAIGTLDKFLLKEDINQEVKEKLISDLLKGVKAMHDKGYVHQDLKPQNLLIFADDKGGYTLKIADFGEARKHNAQGEFGAGPHKYQSPELAYYYTNSQDTDKANRAYGEKYFSQHLNILGRLAADAPQNATTYPTDKIKREQYKGPHQSNDMWAVGMVVYQIQHGIAPESVKDIEQIKSDPLLHGLLDANRESRIDIDAAIKYNAEIAETKTRNYDKKEPGHRYYIGVDLNNSPDDLAPDARESLGDDIYQHLEGLSIEELKPTPRNKWHMTIGWLENKDSEFTPISDETYQKILPHIAPIVAKCQNLELEIASFSPNKAQTMIHADFKEKTGQLDILRRQIKLMVEKVAPEVTFKTAWPHALVAQISTPLDISQITPMKTGKTYQIANMSVMYHDEHTNKNVVAERFVTTATKKSSGASSVGFFQSQTDSVNLPTQQGPKKDEEQSNPLNEFK